SVYVSLFFFSSRRRHTRFSRDWSSDVCSSDLSPSARVSLADDLPPPMPETDILAWLTQALVRYGAGVLFVACLLETAIFAGLIEIGRASCRERVWISGGAGALQKAKTRDDARG